MKKNVRFSSLFAIILFLAAFSIKVIACDEFAIDPNDPNFCGGNGGNPDAPLDTDLIYLMVCTVGMAIPMFGLGKKMITNKVG